jgi:hypothetical protein
VKVCRSSSSNAAPLLLLCGYRDNEVTSHTHPLWMFLDELRAKGVSCNSIMLQVRSRLGHLPFLSTRLTRVYVRAHGVIAGNSSR